MDVEVGDAPPAFFGPNLNAINVAISEIDVVDGSGRNQVVAQYTTPMLVNLLAYQNGAGDSVGQASVDTQTYQDIRFVVDVGGSGVLFNGGISAPLNFVTDSDSSSAHAGKATNVSWVDTRHIAITVNEPFSIGMSADELVNVDFNLLESLTPPSIGSERGNGNGRNDSNSLGLRVRPALFVAANSNSGEITGTVVNENGRPVQNAIVVAINSNGQVGNTVATDNNGNFLLHTLQAGSYRLTIYNQYRNSAGASLQSQGASSDEDSLRGPTVLVSPGQNTNAGAITD